MLFYLFLIAAAAATTELPIIELTTTEQAEIQELIAVLMDEPVPTSEIIASELPIQETIVQAHAITITNAIEPSMLEYKHWTGKYSPDIFTISVNGKKVELGKASEIPGNSTDVEIEYSYSFMNGMKSGSRKILYKLNENISQANITFNWKNDWRVIVDNGKAIKEVTA